MSGSQSSEELKENNLQSFDNKVNEFLKFAIRRTKIYGYMPYLLVYLNIVIDLFSLCQENVVYPFCIYFKSARPIHHKTFVRRGVPAREDTYVAIGM